MIIEPLNLIKYELYNNKFIKKPTLSTSKLLIHYYTKQAVIILIILNHIPTILYFVYRPLQPLFCLLM